MLNFLLVTTEKPLLISTIFIILLYFTVFLSIDLSLVHQPYTLMRNSTPCLKDVLRPVILIKTALSHLTSGEPGMRMKNQGLKFNTDFLGFLLQRT